MINKGEKLYSIFYSKCARCSEGNVYESANPYNLKKFDALVINCSVCGQNNDPEPGFYFGAMYVSYGLTVGIGIVTSVVMILLSFSVLTIIITLSAILILLAPLSFRWSRMIWLNMFVHYDKKFLKQKQETGFE